MEPSKGYPHEQQQHEQTHGYGFAPPPYNNEQQQPIHGQQPQIIQRKCYKIFYFSNNI